MTIIKEMLHQLVRHCHKCSSKLFYDVKCVELICVRSKKIGKIMHTHTYRGGRVWLRGSVIAYVSRAEPKCKVFHYILIRSQVRLK